MSKAFVLILCETGTENSVIANLNSINSVNAVGVFGTYDIIAKIEMETDIQLQNNVTKIRKLQKIRGTLTLISHDGTNLFEKKLTDIEKETLKEYMAHAYVIVHSKNADEANILHKLANIPEVIEADIVMGSYELICKVVAPTYNDISDVITKKIRKLENIKSTVTLNIINN